MHKNRMLELAQISQRSDKIGSKLKVPLITQPSRGSFDNLTIMIDQFNKNTEQINQLKSQYKKTVNPTKQKYNSNLWRQIAHKINQIAGKNQKMINPIDQELKRIDQKYNRELQVGNKQNYYKVASITKKAKNSIQQFKNIQQKFSNGIKENIRRHATIVQKQITEKQLEQIMANPQKSEEIFKAKLLDSPSDQLQNNVSDILDKYRDLVQLQKNMNECLEMTRQLGLLVQVQGEKLTNIEKFISEADGEMVKAKKDLEDAENQDKSSRKKMCCIIILIILAIGAILIPVLITQLS